MSHVCYFLVQSRVMISDCKFDYLHPVSAATSPLMPFCGERLPAIARHVRACLLIALRALMLD